MSEVEFQMNIGSCITEEFCLPCNKITSRENGSCTSCRTRELKQRRDLQMGKWLLLSTEEKLDYIFEHLILAKT